MLSEVREGIDGPLMMREVVLKRDRWEGQIEAGKRIQDVRATPKPASSMAHSTVTRALVLWAYI